MAGEVPAVVERFAPVAPEERIAVLDILRAFALFGILVINMSAFAQPIALWYAGEAWGRTPMDKTVEFFIHFFGTGKFNSIFSFLFGVGLTIQMDRAAAKHANFVPVYLRRVAVLLLFGLLHVFFLWIGDVLHVYALLGFVLLLLRRIPDKALLGIIVAIVIGPGIYSAWQASLNKPPEHPPSYWQARIQQETAVYRQGTYSEQTRMRFSQLREGYLEQGFGWFFASLGVTVLLGFHAGRRHIFQNLAENKPFIKRVMWWGLGIGAVCTFGFAAGMMVVDRSRPTWGGFFVGMMYSFARPTFCMFYVAGLTLLSMQPQWQRRFRVLALTGRMPLTNYLMQSVIATWIFYSYGLGQFGKIGPAGTLVISIAIFAVQVAYSSWWMERRRYGPMEWLWRWLTYGKAPAMRPVAP